MKSSSTKTILLACGVLFLQGCIAFPPLLQVEHRRCDTTLEEQVLERLDQIDRRLEKLERALQR